MASETWASSNGYNKLLTTPKFAGEVESAFPQLEQSKSKRIGETTVRVRTGLRKQDVSGAITPSTQTNPKVAGQDTKTPSTEEAAVTLFSKGPF